MFVFPAHREEERKCALTPIRLRCLSCIQRGRCADQSRVRILLHGEKKENPPGERERESERARERERERERASQRMERCFLELFCCKPNNSCSELCVFFFSVTRLSVIQTNARAMSLKGFVFERAHVHSERELRSYLSYDRVRGISKHVSRSNMTEPGTHRHV